MKSRNLFKYIVLTAMVSLFAMVAAMAQSTDTIPQSANFGSIGLIKGQTVRVTGLVVGPCNIPVEVVFLDGDGFALGAASFEIMPERTKSFDLNFDSLNLRETRLQVRALVKYSVHAEHIDEEKVVPTLEIIDNRTGKTTFGWSVPEPAEMPECPAPGE